MLSSGRDELLYEKTDTVLHALTFSIFQPSWYDVQEHNVKDDLINSLYYMANYISFILNGKRGNTVTTATDDNTAKLYKPKQENE